MKYITNYISSKEELIIENINTTYTKIKLYKILTLLIILR